MKIKQITPFIILLLIISLSASCSLDNANVTSNKEQQIKAFRAEVEALAKEYGVSVYINEDVWAQSLPSYEDVEALFVSAKTMSEKRNLPTVNTLQSIDYKPLILKTQGEYHSPTSGTLTFYDELIRYVNNNYDIRAYVDVEVDWTWGGSSAPDDVEIDGDVCEINYSGYYTVTVDDLEYLFSGYRGSFTASCVFKYFRNTSISSEELAYNIDIYVTYNDQLGVGSVIVDLDENTIRNIYSI